MEGHQIAAVAAEQREYGLMSESFFACNLSALAEATVRRTSAISVAVSDPLRVESTVRKSNRLNIWHRLASISTLRLVSRLDTNGWKIRIISEPSWAPSIRALPSTRNANPNDFRIILFRKVVLIMPLVQCKLLLRHCGSRAHNFGRAARISIFIDRSKGHLLPQMFRWLCQNQILWPRHGIPAFESLQLC